MGKRSGFNFLDELEQGNIQTEEAAREKANVANQQTATIADKQFNIEFPTDQMVERMKGVEDTPQTQVANQPVAIGTGPNPENVQPADLQSRINIDPSQESIREVQKSNIPNVADPKTQGLYGETIGQLGPKQKSEALYSTLTKEAIDRPNFNSEVAKLFGNEVEREVLEDNANKRLIAEDDGMMNLTAALSLGSKSFQFGSGKGSLFGEKVNLTDQDISDSLIDPMSVLKNNSSEFSYALKGYDKLNLLVDPSNPQSDIRDEAGSTAMMAVIFELGNRLQLQDKEADKVSSQRQYDSALDRVNMGKAVGSTFERLLYPTQGSDPSEIFTGETSEFGYKYRTTERERSLLGQVILEGLASSSAFDWIEGRTITMEDGKQKRTYETTRTGENKLSAIRSAARQALGMAKHNRPVSNVPLNKGRLRGEGAYTQKQLTTQVQKNYLTKEIDVAIQAASTVAHTTSPHKLLLLGGILNSMNPFLQKATKQDSAYLKKKRLALEKEYKERAAVDPSFTPESLGGEDFAAIAAKEAMRIQGSHRAMRVSQMNDGLLQSGRSFFYGFTAINNSSRLMITQTELNYQADKTARFIVDGAKQSKVVKGSNSKTERGFLQILARAIVPGADKISNEAQLREFEKNKDQYIQFGNELLAYTEANASNFNDLKTKAENGNDTQTSAGLSLSPGLQALFEEQGKDAFYFTMDALHELARYEAMPSGGTLLTRVKAEIDGNSNGAVIQAYQMGVENILRKGGVLYETNPSTKSLEDFEGDIRDDVFNFMFGQEQLVKEPKTWDDIFEKIRDAKGKVKELMKLPIMTSIYGQDAQFHEESARKFIDDNPDFFANLDYEESVADLTKYLEVALNNGLGGALAHAKLAKRMGRVFNFAERMATTVGPNGFEVQSGGFEYSLEDTIMFDFGPEADQRTKPAQISLMKRDFSAAAEAKKKKVKGGFLSNPGSGSKLRNQFAVNATQNIDATIAQRTITEVIGNNPDNLVMQVYDAFMGDSDTFIELKSVANRVFLDVNKKYNLLESERDGFNKMKRQMREDIAKAKARNELMDIGRAGKYKELGKFVFFGGSIIRRDMEEGKIPKGTYDQINILRAMVKESEGGDPNVNMTTVKGEDPSVKVTPEVFLELFNKSIEILNIENDLNKMIAEVNAERKRLSALITDEYVDQYA